MPVPERSLIDVKRDRLVTVAAMTKKHLGRAISKATAWRWIVRGGSNGVRLEAVKLMGVWHTTARAFREFIRRQSTAAAALHLHLPDGQRVARTPEQAAARAALMKKIVGPRRAK